MSMKKSTVVSTVIVVILIIIAIVIAVWNRPVNAPGTYPATGSQASGVSGQSAPLGTPANSPQPPITTQQPAAYIAGISGTVTLDTGKPYATRVTVYRAADPADPFVISSSTANGSYKIALPPGQYTLNAGTSTLPQCSKPSTSVGVGSSGYDTVNITCSYTMQH